VLCLCAAVACTWAIGAALVRPAWINLSQRNSPAATLLVAGARAIDGDAPYRVAVTPGATVALSLRGPPGHTFWLLAGVPHPACEGNPYGSIVDIELRDGLAAAFVQYGVLDDDGRATVSWLVRPLADGRWPGLQALTFPGDQHRRSTASAAFYFVPD
jgi:hypothetical protein